MTNNLPTTSVLLVDDEPQLLRSTSMVLRTSGFNAVATLDDSRQVLDYLDNNSVSVVLLDLNMPFIDGNEVLRLANEKHPEVPIIMMTAANELETAVNCMRNGAVDYLVKPVEKSRLVSSVTRALEVQSLKQEVENLRNSLLENKLKKPDIFAPIVTESTAMFDLFRYLEAIAVTNQAVLISGETGSGKELFARAIHDASSRTGNFIAVSVSGLDDTAFSDTLFGHKKGAFTGAEAKRDGLVKAAQNGTLFLDEIGDLSESLQVKLLRMLQEREYYPLGEDHPVNTNARIVCATNVDLPAAIKLGKFRMDLYYRLRSHQVTLPALRDRTEDLPILLEHLVAKAAAELERKPPNIPVELYTLLKSYSFPGNIRELEGMVYDAVARQQGNTLSLTSFKSAIGESCQTEQGNDPETPKHSNGNWPGEGPLPTLKEAEDNLIHAALIQAEGNQGIAAGLLGITRQALNKRLIRARDKP